VAQPAESWQALLRAHGLRVTAARAAVLDALVAAGEHPSADDIAAAAQHASPGMHRSTVYRTLDALERAGIVAHVHLGHGRATYHFGPAAHVHAACERCGAAVEVPPQVLDAVREWLAAEHGFTLDARHFALTGRCAACSGPRPR
jgi:Fe2+ or Zn2+ uptake regulation protein